MKRQLKKQIKQDELLTGFEQALRFLAAHREEARVTGIVVVVVGALAGGLLYLQARRTREARQALAEALEVYHAPVQAELPPGSPTPAGSVYATPQEKLAKAAAAFDGVERKFGSQPAGLTAAYYAALCRLELGSAAEAEKALASLAARHDADRLEPALARLALADLYRRTGQVEKAVDAYRRASEDASLPLPRDHALMSLAALLEEVGRLADARLAYQRLVAEFPGSVYAADARSRAEYLATAG